MAIFSWLSGKSSEAPLAEGLSVEEVTHELPYFTQPGNRFDHLEARDCLKYSVPRMGGSRPSEWSMVQRDKSHGAQFENGWKFVSHDPHVPEPSDQLREVLTRIARESDDGVLEFQATRYDVSIYSEVGGGGQWERRLHRYLTELSKS